MEQAAAKKWTKVERLALDLLATLDESFFFSRLDDFISGHMDIKKSRVFLVLDDDSVRLISQNGKPEKEQSLFTGSEIPAAARHVIRTRCPYMSNNIQRDPLFAQQQEVSGDDGAELCIPIVQEGIVIATIHLQSIGERKFGPEDTAEAVEILSKLEQPLQNMKMYLSAKHLNNVLMKKIKREQEQLMKSDILPDFSGRHIESQDFDSIDNFYKVKDKPIISKSKSMKEVIKLAHRAAKSDIPCLIQGEIGTGREMIAKRIHCRSGRGNFGFVSIDCSVFSEEKLEVEIFGREVAHEGGRKFQPGLIEVANRGTLFLKNIECMSLSLQYKLNLFLNQSPVFRAGGKTPIIANTRILAGTSRDISKRVEEGTFIKSLFFSLNKMPLIMVSLRERKDDIENLAVYFLNKYAKGDCKIFSPEALKVLNEYNWPGNVRELQSIIERANVVSDGMVIENAHLPEPLLQAVSGDDSISKESPFVEMSLFELEKKHICQTLEYLNGNKTRTAKILGITVKTLYNKLRNYGIIS